MSLYRPFTAALQKVRILFQRRNKDALPAVLGDTDGPGARVDIPDMDGFVYCRFKGGAPDANGFGTLSTPFPVRSGTAAYPNYPGAEVYIAYNYANELEIVGANNRAFDQAGVDTRSFNPGSQQSKWVYLFNMAIAYCSAVANSVNDSFLVTVKKFRHYTGNVFETFETGVQADKVDLSSYVPAADMHCYAAVWLDTYTNTAVVTTSTAQSLFTPLDSTDIQQLVASRPADGIPLKAFYLSNAQGSITQQDAKNVDLRQFLNMPQVWGFPTTLTTKERVRPGYTLVTGAYTPSGSGALTVESGGRVIIKAVDNLSATTDPTVNDDSGDGYSIGSVWINTTADTVWVLTDATGGAAVWVNVAATGSGAPTDATYITQTPHAGLSAEQALSALATGILKSTTTTGVVSIAAAGTDYTSPTGTENLSNKTITASSLIATALSLLIGGFKAIFTHANSADRTYTFPNASGTVALTTDITFNAAGDTGAPQAITSGNTLSVLGDGITTETVASATDTLTVIVRESATPLVCDYRLSCANVNDSLADVSTAASLYLAGFGGDRISLYDGRWYLITPTNAGDIPFHVNWASAGNVTITNGSPNYTVDFDTRALTVGMTIVGSNTSGTISAITGTFTFTSTANATATTTEGISFKMPDNGNFDVFAYLTGTSADIGLTARAWTNNTTRASALAYTNRRLHLTGAPEYLYLGTAKTRTGQINVNDTITQRHLWNYYNRKRRTLRVIDTTNSWNDTNTTPHQFNSSAANQVEVMIGLASLVSADLRIDAYGSIATQAIGVGYDDLTTFDSENIGKRVGSVLAVADWQKLMPAIGMHTLSWNAVGAVSGVWFGDNNTTNMQSGMIGGIEA